MTLADAMAAARAGRREDARTLLMRVLETDERNAQAWLWLSGVVDDPEEMRVCLENVLHLEPSNAHALKGIAILDQKYGRPEARAVGDPVAAPAAEAAPQPAPIPAPEPSRPAPAAEALPVAPAPAAEVAAPALGDAAPCPCCGAMMPLKLQRCTQCNRSMLLHTPPNPDERSISLMVLGVLWVIPVLIMLVAVVFLWFPISVALSGGYSGRGVDTSGQIVFLILFGMVMLAAILIARGLFLKQGWAYILASALLGLQALVLLWQVVQTVALVISMKINLALLTADSMSVWVLFILLFVSLLWLSLQGFLLYRGYPKVFGRKVRLVHTVGAGLPAEHYTLGLALKEQGMWYAAMQEWEAACAGDHANVQYLHVLGLSYAKVHQRAKAMATLEQALGIAPNDQRLRETYQMVQSLG